MSNSVRHATGAGLSVSYCSLIIALLSGMALVSCSAVKAEPAVSESGTSTSLLHSFNSAHAIRVYVSAVNCEMNSADAKRLNAMSTGGMSVEVVFTGVAENDSLSLELATADLGLRVATRLVRAGELEQYKSIGGVRLPMALVVKAKQLKTIIAGESMPRTLSVLEASMSLMGGQ